MKVKQLVKISIFSHFFDFFRKTQFIWQIPFRKFSTLHIIIITATLLVSPDPWIPFGYLSCFRQVAPQTNTSPLEQHANWHFLLKKSISANPTATAASVFFCKDHVSVWWPKLVYKKYWPPSSSFHRKLLSASFYTELYFLSRSLHKQPVNHILEQVVRVVSICQL